MPMSVNINVVFLLVLICQLHRGICDEERVEVKVEQGVLKGKYWTTRNGRNFMGFTGIPFAKPPIGNLRFKEPVPIDQWEGVLDATKTHNVCPQISIYFEGYPILGDEDCLYLNVYTPKFSVSNNDSLPVMLYLHGGSFVMGSAKPNWLGPDLLLDRDIVLVTTYYRLGALGFLTTGNKAAPANNGLKDQNVALRWVKNNIARFGGDSEKITVFGNSAGAVSAHYHTVSPLSRNLISGAIIQSSSLESSYAITSKENALNVAKILGEMLNCPFIAAEEFINCMQKVDFKEIITKEAKFASWDNETIIPFKPIVEDASPNAFIDEHPLDTIKLGKMANVPIIIGVVAQEAAYKSSELKSKPHFLAMLDKMFNIIVPITFGISKNVKNATEAIRKFYFGEDKIDSSKMSGVTDMYTDGWFVVSHNKIMQINQQYLKKPVYQYLFDFRGSTSYSTLFGDPYNNYGVSHTDELLYLFRLGMTFPDYTPTESDIQMSEVLLTLWTNFAKTGNPNLNTSTSEVWSPVQSTNLEYYHIKNKTNMKMEANLYSDRMNLWKSFH